MDFLSWHYSEGIEYYLKSWMNSFRSINHSYSITLLLRTLLSPYKRLTVAETGAGFDLHRKFQVFTFNIISRGIGAIVRGILIVFALILFCVIAAGGIVGIAFWVLLPPLSYSVYKLSMKQPELIVKKIVEELKSSPPNPLEVVFENDAGDFTSKHLNLDKKIMIENADLTTISFENINMETYHDLISFLVDSKIWSKDFLYAQNISPEDLVATAMWWEQRTREQTMVGNKTLGRPGIALELTFGYTPTLDQYSTDLSKTQPFSHHLIGREQVVNRMVRELTSGQNIFLTGEPGVGKKTVVLEFAQRAATGQLGHELGYKRILEFDHNALLAKSVDLNQKKQELNQILYEAAYAGNTILMIRDLHRLVNVEVEGIDFTDVFENLLEKHTLKIIAVTSNYEYERFLTPNVRIRKFFERIEIIPPTKDEALQILLEAATREETLSNITIQYQALKHMIEISDQYITETPFPEKVIEILDAVITYVRQTKKQTINIDDVNAVLGEKTGISFARLSQEDKGKLGNLENLIHERLVSQDTAVSLISKTLRAKTVGIIKGNRPIGSFLFLGPTGVGKTETAKVLARVYYGSETEIVRFDMAEYAGDEGLERLTGSAVKNQPGVLTTAIKNKPASLLLLDEIEKASREVYNLFLTLLDEGYITDASGKRINCKNLFVIGTSNAAAEYIRNLVQKGVSKEELQREVVNYILEQGIFSPEFINRFDGVVVYEPLTEANLVEVAKHILKDLADNLEEKNIHITFADSAIKKLAHDGFDPAFGARPMKRIVDLTIGDLLGSAILSGEIRTGETIELWADSDFKWTSV